MINCNSLQYCAESMAQSQNNTAMLRVHNMYTLWENKGYSSPEIIENEIQVDRAWENVKHNVMNQQNRCV